MKMHTFQWSEVFVRVRRSISTSQKGADTERVLEKNVTRSFIVPLHGGPKGTPDGGGRRARQRRLLAVPGKAGAML